MQKFEVSKNKWLTFLFSGAKKLLRLLFCARI